MASSAYTLNKKNIYKYKENNKEKIKEYNRNYIRNLYQSDEEYKSKVRAHNLAHYYLKKECKIFMNILLEE